MDQDYLAEEEEYFNQLSKQKKRNKTRKCIEITVLVLLLISLSVVVGFSIKRVNFLKSSSSFNDWFSSPSSPSSPQLPEQDFKTCSVNLPVPSTVGMYRTHRNTLAQKVGGKGDVVVMLGNKQEERTFSDTDILFRQDSSFLYLTGFNIPDAAFAYDIETKYSILFVAKKTNSELIFDGGYDDFEELKRIHEVDQVAFVNEMTSVLSEKFPNLNVVHTINEEELVKRVPTMAKFEIDDTDLLSAIRLVRQVKSQYEVEHITYSTLASSAAHKAVMRQSTVGWTEADLESIFLHECYNCGMRFQSYIPIVATGINSHILHYVKNDVLIRDGDLILIDAAGEFRGYTSDITRTFPANGRFTEDQKLIYNIVLAAQEAAIRICRAGQSWSTVQSASTNEMIKGLLNAKLLQGATVEELVRLGIASTFQPHGLGHPVGLDVHDPYPSPNVLQVNHMFTIEPGIYFNEMLLDDAKENPVTSKYYNWEVIDRFRNFGGVRIEDIILITPDGGYKVVSNVPKTVDEIEDYMSLGHLVGI